MLTLYGGTGSQQLDTLYETMQETLETLKNTGITEKELMNSKEQLKGNLMLSLESTNSRMSRNGKMNCFFVNIVHLMRLLKV